MFFAVTQSPSGIFTDKKGPPTFVQGLKDLAVTDGDEVELTVQVKGKNTIQWKNAWKCCCKPGILFAFQTQLLKETFFELKWVELTQLENKDLTYLQIKSIQQCQVSLILYRENANFYFRWFDL